MGHSNQSGSIKVEHPNDYFLSLSANPQNDTMLAEVNVMDMSTFNSWSNSVQKMKQQGSTNMLLPKNSKILQKSLCGQSFKLQIEYPCYHILLSKEIDKRHYVQKYLQEAEMWYLLYCLAQTAHSCSKLERPIGDVRPQNLLLNKEGNLKILSNMSVPLGNETFQVPTIKTRRLFSPQQLEALKKAHKKPLDNPILSESFSIGMTVLAAGVLKDASTCYHYLLNQINMLQFNKMTNFWYQNQFYSQAQEGKVEYSQQLKNIVMNLVEINPERRMSIIQVYLLLSDFREDIMKLQPFHFKVDRWSPKKKNSSSKISSSANDSSIHILCSRRKSQKSSPKKSQKVQIQQFNSNFSIESPLPQQSLNNSANKTFSPTRTRKITTTISISNKSIQNS